MNEAELRRAINFVQGGEHGTIYFLAILADAVERVLDLCAEHEASNDEFDGFQDVDVDTRLVRAALYGDSTSTKPSE